MEKKQEMYVSKFHKDVSKFAGNHQTTSYWSYVFHTGQVGTWFCSGIGSAGLMIGFHNLTDLFLPQLLYDSICKHYV